MPTLRPSGDVSSTGFWLPGTGDLTRAAGMVTADGNGPAGYVRGPTDPAGMIGAGNFATPDAYGASRSYAAGTSRVYSVIPGATATYHYEYLLLAVPQAARTDPVTPRPVVVYFHGASNTEQQPFITAGAGAMLDDWLAQGWPVVIPRQGMTVNADGTDANDGKWSNGPTRDGFADLARWLRRLPFNVSKVLLYGFSAGANAALNFMREAAYSSSLSYPVAGCELVDGAVNLRWWWDHANHGPFRTAYGLPITAVDTSGPVWAAAVDTPRNGHDPMIADLTPYTGVPFRLSASSADGTVDDVNNLIAFNARLSSAAWPHAHTYTATAHDHGDVTHFDAAATRAFFLACLAGTL